MLQRGALPVLLLRSKKGAIMKPLRDEMASPTPWDSYRNYSGEMPDPKWLCLMAKHRDSDILTESNWICALELLGGESDTVQIDRTGHWACGWIEWLSVLEGSPAQEIAEKIEERIECYPILNEEHFSEMETESADQIWKECYTWEQRIEWIRDNESQCEFWDFSCMVSAVKGNYFPGYASEMAH